MWWWIDCIAKILKTDIDNMKSSRKSCSKLQSFTKQLFALIYTSSSTISSSNGITEEDLRVEEKDGEVDEETQYF